MRALERQPEQRFQTALELQGALEAYARHERLECSSLALAGLLGDLFGKDRAQLAEDRLAAGSITESVRPPCAVGAGGAPRPRQRRRGWSGFAVLSAVAAAGAAWVLAAGADRGGAHPQPPALSSPTAYIGEPALRAEAAGAPAAGGPRPSVEIGVPVPAGASAHVARAREAPRRRSPSPRSGSRRKSAPDRPDPAESAGTPAEPAHDQPDPDGALPW
jgi:hypothetical protein